MVFMMLHESSLLTILAKLYPKLFVDVLHDLPMPHIPPAFSMVEDKEGTTPPTLFTTKHTDSQRM